MVRVRRRSKNFWRKEIERGIGEYDEEKRERRWQQQRQKLARRLANRRLAAHIIITRLSLPRLPAVIPTIHRWRPDQPALPS
jgi:hypothetical protein